MLSMPQFVPLALNPSAEFFVVWIVVWNQTISILLLVRNQSHKFFLPLVFVCRKNKPDFDQQLVPCLIRFFGIVFCSLIGHPIGQ